MFHIAVVGVHQLQWRAHLEDHGLCQEASGRSSRPHDQRLLPSLLHVTSRSGTTICSSFPLTSPIISMTHRSVHFLTRSQSSTFHVLLASCFWSSYLPFPWYIRLLFLFPGISILGTFLSMCSSSLLISVQSSHCDLFGCLLHSHGPLNVFVPYPICAFRSAHQS